MIGLRPPPRHPSYLNGESPATSSSNHLKSGSSTDTSRFLTKSLSDTKLFNTNYLNASNFCKPELPSARVIAAIQKPSDALKKQEALYSRVSSRFVHHS